MAVVAGLYGCGMWMTGKKFSVGGVILLEKQWNIKKKLNIILVGFNRETENVRHSWSESNRRWKTSITGLWSKMESFEKLNKARNLLYDDKREPQKHLSYKPMAIYPLILSSALCNRQVHRRGAGHRSCSSYWGRRSQSEMSQMLRVDTHLPVQYRRAYNIVLKVPDLSCNSSEW